MDDYPTMGDPPREPPAGGEGGGGPTDGGGGEPSWGGPPAGGTPAPSTGYPIRFELDYGTGARSKGNAFLGVTMILKAIWLIPHLILLVLLLLATIISAWIGYIAIAFTGKQPDGITNLIRGTISWANRVQAWFYSTTDEYPPFAMDAPQHPAKTTVDGGGHGDRSKGWAVMGIFLLKLIAALPHLIILGALDTVASWAAWFGFWIILFTGKQPQGIHDLLVGVQRWNTRAMGWLGSLTDEYPPFALT